MNSGSGRARARRRSAATARLACCVTAVVAMAAGVSGCSGGSGSKPAAAVTGPSISGKPAMAVSVDAALAKEAFTPYAGLGTLVNDGLAPNESLSSLATACITTAGYPAEADAVPIGVVLSEGLALTEPFGAWGYTGAAQAAKAGFFPVPGSNLAEVGLNGSGTDPDDLPAPEQSAAKKCSGIVNDFEQKQWSTSLADISTLDQAVVADDAKDPSVVKATAAWSTCMAKDGYDYSAPKALATAEMQAVPHDIGPGSGPAIAPGQQSAQIAAAEADAACTESTDLDGIYFAVQASYEQQIVEANQQQLNAAVQQYRTAYQTELSKMSSLLVTAPTTGPPL